MRARTIGCLAGLIACLSLPGPEDPRGEVVRLARARSAALVAKDMGRLTAILADEFVYTNASGEVVDRAAYLERYVRAPEVRWHTQELDEIEVHVVGTTAILTCCVHDRARFGEHELDARFRSTFAFAKTAGGWRCIAGHTSSAEPAQ